MELLKKYGSYINGKTVYGLNSFPCINPANGNMLAESLGADTKLLNEAVAAAQTAYPSWKKSSRAERADLLRKMADRIEQNLDFWAGALCDALS